MRSANCASAERTPPSSWPAAGDLQRADGEASFQDVTEFSFPEPIPPRPLRKVELALTRAVAEAELTRFIKADLNADRFSWSVDEAAIAEAEPFDGKLALITNAPDLSLAEVVARYKGLADIERGFRVLKSDTEIAPVHHRLPDRIRAHAMICFLAPVLYRVMRRRLKAKGHSASPRTALDLLERIQQHVARIGPTTKTTLTRQQPEQLDLFEALDLKTPA